VKIDCDEEEHNELTERIENILNNKLNNNNKNIIHVNIIYTYADDALDPNSQKKNEPTLDFIRRTLPIFTLFILPGWFLVQDDYQYEFISEGKEVLRFKDYNTGYIVVSLFAFPYILFRTPEDVMIDHIKFVILNQYAIYESNK
jgi:hypothetical protein